MPCTPVTMRIGVSLGTAVGFEQAAELRPAHFGHDQIDHHQVHFFGVQDGERGGWPLGFEDAIFRGFEDGFEQAPVEVQVVHDEDGGRFGSVLQHIGPMRGVQVRRRGQAVVPRKLRPCRLGARRVEPWRLGSRLDLGRNGGGSGHRLHDVMQSSGGVIGGTY